MRKLAWVIAVLALVGCGEGRDVEAPKPKPAATTPAAAAAPQWAVEVRGQTPQAVSDLTGWLIEHSFMSSVVRENGKDRVLVGPLASEAEAQAKQEQINAALVRAKKRNIETLVVDFPPAR